MKMIAPARLGFSVLVCFFLAAPLLSSSFADTAATFMVKDGASPWSDRVGTWCLAKVPAGLQNKGPLPQQSCGSRVIVLPAGTKVVVFAVSNTDVATFKAKFPKAQPTGETVSVVHADGSNEIPYTIFKYVDPPATVGEPGLSAGLILLQLGDKSGSD